VKTHLQTTSNTTKSNSKKMVVFTLLTMLLLSAAAVSMVNATDEDKEIIAPPEPSSDGMVPPEEGQLVYALDDNVTALADDSTVHDGWGDLPARNYGPVGAEDDVQTPEVIEENATLYTTQDSLTEEANLLGASQVAPDYTGAILGAVALAAVAACAVVVVARKRKATAA
jgi:hypothetical protein